MKRLDHGRRGPAGPNEREGGVSRRNFFKVAGAALLGGALAVSPLSFLGREAKAVTPVNIRGMKVYKMKLTDTISNLDKKTKSISNNAKLNEGKVAVVKVPKEGLLVSIGLNGNGKMITLSFPKSPTDSTRKHAGFKLDSLVKLVRKVSGKTPTKAKLIVEFAKDKGQPVINIYAIPLDNSGKVLGKLTSGQLAWGVSYYPNKRPGQSVYGAKALLTEPRKLTTAVASAEED